MYKYDVINIIKLIRLNYIYRVVHAAHVSYNDTCVKCVFFLYLKMRQMNKYFYIVIGIY